MATSITRQFTRIHFSRRVRISFPDKKYDPRHLKDLSLTGMFVTGNFAEEPGSECSIILTQSGASSLLAMKANARVVWKNNEGIAVQFTSMNFDSYMFLQTTLLYEAEDPVYIGLELPDDFPYRIIDETEGFPEKKKLLDDISLAIEEI